MWRSFFLAVGITLCIVGGECLVVDKAIVAIPSENTEQATLFTGGVAMSGVRRRELSLPEWAPWSLLSAGTVVALYSLTIARQG